MITDTRIFVCMVCIITLLWGSVRAGETNLVPDPTFSQTKERDKDGQVFEKWRVIKYEGDCDVYADTNIKRSGTCSCLFVGGNGAKIGVHAPTQMLAAGSYRITVHVRAVGVQCGPWGRGPADVMFDGQYHQLDKKGTYGWTRVSWVWNIPQRKQVTGPSVRLLGPGRLWVDDISLEKMGADDLAEVELLEGDVTELKATAGKLQIGEEEEPIRPPEPLGENSMPCPACRTQNMHAWKRCYACGSRLDARPQRTAGPALKLFTSFEDGSPFKGGRVVNQHATHGRFALRLDQGYVALEERQDWGDYDYFRFDTYTESSDPKELYIEIRDSQTTGYWTRVNLNTFIMPGTGELLLPLKQLFVGEKSRPGPKLKTRDIRKLFISVGKNPSGIPVFIDNMRLERDESAKAVVFEGLYAFDCTCGESGLLPGFQPLLPTMVYDKTVGYGFQLPKGLVKKGKGLTAVDYLQPDPLYQDAIPMPPGSGFAVDLPNGIYRVFLNCDDPSGYWGDYQIYRTRAILAEGKEVVSDTMTLESFRKKYYRFWDTEDTPHESTFEKYVEAYFAEKIFDVEVTDGQLNLEFSGGARAHKVSAIVIFPKAKETEGERFLAFAKAKRRFFFDMAFRRVLHAPRGDKLAPTPAEETQGAVVFRRGIMEDVYYNDTPLKDERCQEIAVQAFAGEYEPATFSLVPLQDLGRTRVAISDLKGEAGTIPTDAVDIGYASYRVSRITMDGAAYTIKPRLVIPRRTVSMPKGVTRRFWLTVRTPSQAKPGIYKGRVAVTPGTGQPLSIALALRVLPGTLDLLDIPAGPFGHTINLPWFNEKATQQWNQDMKEKSLRRIRAYGFTSFGGMPSVRYRGLVNGTPVFDFRTADAQMKLARDLGFTMPVVSYGAGVRGLSMYEIDWHARGALGQVEYSQFLKLVWGALHKHASEAHWLPVYWALCDEPSEAKGALKRAIANAQEYAKAFPVGPPFFTGFTSFRGSKQDDPHFELARAFHAVAWGLHDEASVNLIHEAGRDWAFYNGGNRWTYGTYLYKAVKEFGCKFRIAWHWNVVAGDPYYALDCREDDYAWCNSSPTGELIPSIDFERLREGVDDYRRLLTLARLAKEKAGTPAAQTGVKLIEDRLGAFKLGQCDHDKLFGKDDWKEFRRQLDEAIVALRK